MVTICAITLNSSQEVHAVCEELVFCHHLINSYDGPQVDYLILAKPSPEYGSIVMLSTFVFHGEYEAQQQKVAPFTQRKIRRLAISLDTCESRVLKGKITPSGRSGNQKYTDSLRRDQGHTAWRCLNRISERQVGAPSAIYHWTKQHIFPIVYANT